MFIRFLLVGGLGFVIDLGLTYLLIHLGVEPWLARPPAIISAALFTWLANRQFTYKIKVKKNTYEAMRYALVAMAVAAMNYSIYIALIEFDIAPILAVTMATAVQTIVSFHAYRWFAFKPSS